MKKIFSFFILTSILFSQVSAEVGGTITRSLTGSTTILVGNDKDEHGCIGSAGYSWNETKKECVRAWEEEPTMCTMQYDPVCGIDGVTYGNSCSAGKVKVAYAGECNLNSGVSEGSDGLTNDDRLYNHIKATLSKKAQQKVGIVLKKYETRIAKFSKTKKQEVNNSVITALENEIFKITMKYPQDIALPESANNAYLTITLLKMEIEKLNTK